MGGFNNYDDNQNFKFIEEQGHEDQTGFSYISAELPKKKRKGGYLKKAVSLILTGVLFGGAAGGTMVGVNRLAGRYLSDEQQNTLPAVPSTPVISNTNSSGGTGYSGVGNVSSIVKMAMPSIVAISSTSVQQYNSFFGQSQSVEVPSSGSGIIVGQNDEELLIATNNHVVADSQKTEVEFIDGSRVPALVKGTDSESDLAVLAVKLSDIPAESLSQIKVATLGDSDKVEVGEAAIAIGNALGYGQSVTVGHISAKERSVTIDDVTRSLIQTDAAINPGNSGGALLNINGEVIGINVAKSSGSGIEGMGYAIPISYAHDILSDLMSKTTKTLIDSDKQGYIGIQGAAIDAQTIESLGIPRGVYVYRIVENTPAAQSELKEKDVITKLDGEKVYQFSDIQELLKYYEGGQRVTLTVQRLEDGKYVEKEIELTLGYRTEMINQ